MSEKNDIIGAIMNKRAMLKDHKKDCPRQGRISAKTSAIDSRPEDALRDEHLRFERLIFDLSARFVRVRPDRVDEEIERSLREVLDFFRVDRCGLVRVLQDGRFIHVSHACYAEGLEEVPKESILSTRMFLLLYRRTLPFACTASFRKA